MMSNVKKTSQNAAGLLKAQTWISGKQFAVIAVTQIDQEIGLKSSIREKPGIDLCQINPTHWPTVSPTERAAIMK